MRITDSVYVVGGGDDGFGLSHKNDCTIYLVCCDGPFVLIDAGTGLARERILENILAEGIDPADIEAIFITHAHGDHCGGLAGLQEISSAKAYASEDCARFIADGDIEAMSLKKAILAGMYPADYSVSKAEIKAIADGESVRVGNRDFTLLETPGHSDGHACYKTELNGKNALFSGDLIFYDGRILLQSTWDCRLEEYWASIRRMNSLGVESLFPSHQAFLLEGGQRPFEKAVNCLDRLAIPDNLK